tara:strand:+ start:53 stop:301 length:249 start_codon:yes stop_codon:yes gene_type:complete
MNNARRKKIKKICKQLAELETQIREIEKEEQDAFDNLPESLADTERGDQMQEFLEILDQAAGQLEESQETLDEVITTETAIS